MDKKKTDKQSPRFFKIYISVMLTLVVIFLIAVTVLGIYGVLKIKNEAKTVSNKVNTFNVQANNINTSLQNLNEQVQHNTEALSSNSLSQNVKDL